MRRKFKLFPIILLLILITGCGSSNVLYTGEIAIPGAVPGEIEVIMERSEPENADNEDMMQNMGMEAVSE